MDETKILQDQIISAPKEIQNFLMRDEWSNIVQKISQRNNFSAEQKTALENEIIFVLVGMESRNNFKENIKNITNIQEIWVEAIAQEINEKIFNRFEKFLATEIETSETTTVEIPPENLPMIESGEVAHDTKPEPTIKPSTPSTPQKPSYADGNDPYREPLQ